MYVVNPEKCLKCELCVTCCSQKAPHTDGDAVVIDSSLCIECGACADMCPNEAIEEVDKA
ncbi:MAG: indolepyruvate ferredoxin oxidoreductase subunit alpha [Ignavibacteriales bacterium]